MGVKRSVLITGASSGIGAKTAEYLNTLGYHVILVARNREKLFDVAKNLAEDTLVIQYDLQELNGIEKIFSICKENNRVLYGMVHCAGINRDQPIKTNSLKDMMDVMNTNLLSFIELAKFFSKKKYSCDGGAIVAMSSTAAIACPPGMCTYAASKAGVDAAMQVMSKELARRNIRVNTIQPTYVNTEMGKSTLNSEEKFSNIPLGVIEPEYVAYLIGFLLSEQARYISGTAVKMSGAQL